VIFAGDQKAGFVLFVSVGIPSKAPTVFVPEVSNPAKMSGRVPESLDPLSTRLAGRWSNSKWQVRFAIHVDIAESAAEADVDSREFTSIVFGGVVKNPPLRAIFDGGRDALPAGMGAVNPTAHLDPLSLRLRAEGVRGRSLFRRCTAGFARWLLLCQDLVLNLGHKFAGYALIQAPRHGHSREHALDEQLSALLGQLVCSLAEFHEFFSVSLLDHCGAILSKPFLDRPTWLGKVFVQGRRVIPVPVLEGF
jgi:hypothetical protein